MTLTGNAEYITTTEGLRSLADRLRGAALLAVDTEFMRERTYYAKLCLVQVSDGATSALIDPLEIEDLEPLWEILFDQDTLKLFHAGAQDLEIFFNLTGKVPYPVFDTQVAAALASFPLQAGYGLLVGELLGVDLDKTESFTDWARRPLADVQLEYALNDVLYLPEVYRLLNERLERDGRLEWLEPDFAQMVDPATYSIVSEEMYRKVKRRIRLRRREMGVLLHLAAWREREAMRRDLPRNRIVNDQALVQIAARKSQTREDLRAIRGLHDSTVRRDGEDILAAVRSGVSMPESELPVIPRRVRGRADVDAVTDLMSALVRTRAREYGIAVSVLASRKKMEALAYGERDDSPLLSGWRRSHVGDDLVDLLEGRIVLSLHGTDVRVERREEDGPA